MRNLFVPFSAQFSLWSLALGLSFSSLTSFAKSYKVDAGHTEVGFSVKHLAISTVRGKFKEFEGSFELDDKTGVLKSAKADIKTASIDTGHADRDKHLVSKDFFNAEKNPKITFVMKEYKGNKDGGKMRGEFTMNGVTQPIELDVKMGGTATDPWGNQKAGFSASGKINRKDYGITWNKTLDGGGLVVGEDVTLNIEVEGDAVDAAAKKGK